MNDARRQQAEDKRSVANIDAVPGVVSALVTGDDIKSVRKQIDDFSFSFVAPLGADNYDDNIGLFGL